MAKCTINLPFEGSKDALYDVVVGALAQHGGQLTGDRSTGQIAFRTPAGPVSGTYLFQPGYVQIEILDKPFVVTCGRIESELTKALASVAHKLKATPAVAAIPGTILVTTHYGAVTVTPRENKSKIIELDPIEIEGQVPEKRPAIPAFVLLLALALGGYALFRRPRSPRR